MKSVSNIGVVSTFAASVLLAGFSPTAQGAIVDGDAIYTEHRERVSEPTHGEILEHLYGGTFVATGGHGLDFTNGVIYVQRIADDRATPDQTAIGQTNGDLFQYTDRVWQDQFSTVQARARFANYGQAFGYVPFNNGLGYEELFSAYHDSEYDMPQSAAVPDLEGATFLWARNGDNGVWTSHPDQNRDGLDHLITYKVIPADPVRTDSTDDQALIQDLLEWKTFLLFWEDQTFKGDNVHDYDSGDWDYNDLVVEVRAQYNEIPEPGTALAGAGLLAMLGLRRRRA